MLKKPQVWCYDEVQRVAAKQLDGCAHTHMYWRRDALYFLNLSWFSAFDFLKIMKYACDRKFTEVCVSQKLPKQSLI